MNRLEFIGQTHQGKLISIDDIIKFFDYTMAAYEIVESVENIQVHSNTDDIHSTLTLKIQSPNLAELQDVVTYVNNTIHNHKNIYGRSFNINASVEGNSVDMFVREDYVY